MDANQSLPKDMCTDFREERGDREGERIWERETETDREREKFQREKH